MAGALQYQDLIWWSADGLRLHARDYPGPDDVPPVICIPGLTRNARDFGPLVAHLAGKARLICVDLRGRGESGYAKDPMTYVPLTYWQDLEALIAQEKLGRFSLIGTSLGGLVAMMLASHGADRIAATVINDVGPVIEAAGLLRIRSYVGKGGAWPTWMHAARALAESNAAIYPDYSVEQWLAMAKRLYKLSPNGRIVQDYDPRIAEPFRLPGEETSADMWPTFDYLKPVPTLILRGAQSDILSIGTVSDMLARLDHCQAVTIPAVGHAPVLDETEAVTAITALIGDTRR